MTDYTIENIINGLRINVHQNQNSDSLQVSNPKIIAFYAEKGGVGKTTSCLTLAHTFAARGKRVLIYDCDVQRSLTAWCFGNNIEFDYGKTVNKIDNFIKNLQHDKNFFSITLYDQVDNDNSLKPAYALNITENLYVVCGDRQMPLLDEKISNMETITSEAINSLFGSSIPNQKSGRPYHAIMKTANHYKIDYVFLDLNPYPGILNRCLLMSSNYIVIPVCLDYFCVEMMYMMKSNLEKWKTKTTEIINSTRREAGIYPWPNHSPKFLGYIINKVCFPNSAPEPSEQSRFNDWPLYAGTYQNIYQNMMNNQRHYAELIHLQAVRISVQLGVNRPVNPLAINIVQYMNCGLTQNLGHIIEYHGLGIISDLLKITVPFLESDQFFRQNRDDNRFQKISGDDKKRMTRQLYCFRDMYAQIARNIITLVEHDANSTSDIVKQQKL